jgi:hypothetical protein
MLWLSLLRAAMLRVLQCVAPRGMVSRVAVHHLLHLLVADPSRRAAARLVDQPNQAPLDVTRSPLAHRLLRDGDLSCHLAAGHTAQPPITMSIPMASASGKAASALCLWWRVVHLKVVIELRLVRLRQLFTVHLDVGCRANLVLGH